MLTGWRPASQADGVGGGVLPASAASAKGPLTQGTPVLLLDLQPMIGQYPAGVGL